MPTSFGGSIGSSGSGGSGAGMVNTALMKSERPAGGFLARAESSKVNIDNGGGSSSFGPPRGGNLDDQFDRLDVNDRSMGKQSSFE